MDVNKLFEGTVSELERMLSAKSVVADPIKVDGTTIIPLVSMGVGFGAGGAEGQKSEGSGLGSGGGGGVKPVAVVIMDAQGVRVESIKAAGSALGKIAESMTEIAKARMLNPVEVKKLEA